MFYHRLFQRFVVDVRVVLSRQHHRVDALHLTGFFIVNHSQLRFGIGAQPWQSAILAQFALALHQAV